MLLISLRSALADEVYAGSKRCELRKHRARVNAGDRVAIYETKPKGAITGTFIIEDTHYADIDRLWAEIDDTGIAKERFLRYFAERLRGFAMRIRDARRLEQEIGLDVVRVVDSSFRAPQSFLYLKETSAIVVAIESQMSQPTADLTALTSRPSIDPEADTPSIQVWHELPATHEQNPASDEPHLASHHSAELAD
jgi:predicted transcriptional regulator